MIVIFLHSNPKFLYRIVWNFFHEGQYFQIVRILSDSHGSRRVFVWHNYVITIFHTFQWEYLLELLFVLPVDKNIQFLVLLLQLLEILFVLYAANDQISRLIWLNVRNLISFRGASGLSPNKPFSFRILLFSKID